VEILGEDMTGLEDGLIHDMRSQFADLHMATPHFDQMVAILQSGVRDPAKAEDMRKKKRAGTLLLKSCCHNF